MKTTRFVLALILACAVAPAHSQQQPVIGLITKTETNPFFVKMREGATEAAKAKGAKLMTAAGKFDGDNAEPGHRDREHDGRGRQGDPDHAQRHEGHRPGDQEGARRRRAGDCARHADRPAGRDRCALRDRQLQGRAADRPVCQGCHGRQAREDRHARSRPRRHRRQAASRRFPAGLTGSRTATRSIVCSADTRAIRRKVRRRWRTVSRERRTSTLSTRSTSRLPRARIARSEPPDRRRTS